MLVEAGRPRIAPKEGPFKMHTKTKGDPVDLAKGQLWKTREGFIEVVDVKRLVHYRILKHPGQRLVRTQMSNVADFQDYLKAHSAGLVE